MKPVQAQLGSLLQAALPQARAELTVLPDAPQIALYLLNEDFSRAPLSPEAVQAVWDRPAYWAFCWASGQVLAAIVLQQPSWVAGKTVLDFGSGSGVVAIAAAKAGAARVIACDIDPDAQLAIRSNARHNHVDVEILQDFYQLSEPVDLIIAADVLYDRDNLPWLAIFLQHAHEVLVADSRIKNFDFPGYQLIARRESTTVPDLDESDEFRQVNIFHARQGVAADPLME